MRQVTKLDFCEEFIYLKGRPISFADRSYLRAPYDSKARRLVIRASRQVEKSTFLVNTILHTAVTRRGTHIVFVCPRQEQARVFSSSRLLPTIEESPLIRHVLLGRGRVKIGVMNQRYANGSEVYIRAAYHSADPVAALTAIFYLSTSFRILLVAICRCWRRRSATHDSDGWCSPGPRRASITISKTISGNRPPMNFRFHAGAVGLGLSSMSDASVLSGRSARPVARRLMSRRVNGKHAIRTPHGATAFGSTI